MKTKKKKDDTLVRLNSRITPAMDKFLKKEVAKSKGKLSEGDVVRSIFSKGIRHYSRDVYQHAK